jgi:hypothetical protein
MPEFVPGLALCAAFYAEVVGPLLGRAAPGLRHSAAVLGTGSDVLGYDTPMSTDHDWGPRVMLFLGPDDLAERGRRIHEELDRALPAEFGGYPTRRLADDAASHRVELLTLDGWMRDYLGFDAASEPSPADWLTFPEQKLLGITRGAVYHDDLGLETLRARFAYYPHDVWLYLLAAGWTRIGQEEHLMGRAGFVGDEVGSALIGARLVRDVMRLCFLMERTYAPYPKWFGSAFARLACADRIVPTLEGALRARNWREREDGLCAAYEVVAEMHNGLAVTEWVDPRVRQFHDRPFRVIDGERLAAAIVARVEDPEVRRLTDRRLYGSVDQLSDSTDVACDARLRPALRSLYAPREE